MSAWRHGPDAYFRGPLIVLALALILLTASVTSGATDWLEIAVALTLLVAAYLLRRNARRTSV